MDDGRELSCNGALGDDPEDQGFPHLYEHQNGRLHQEKPGRWVQELRGPDDGARWLMSVVVDGGCGRWLLSVVAIGGCLGALCRAPLWVGPLWSGPIWHGPLCLPIDACLLIYTHPIAPTHPAVPFQWLLPICSCPPDPTQLLPPSCSHPIVPALALYCPQLHQQ